MTSLQIARNNWQEQVRHQLASEAEQARHDAETERLTREANAETARSNRAREAQAVRELEESRRHSMQTEAYSGLSLTESQRASMAKEAENLRHDKRMEAISSYQARTQNSREWAKISLSDKLNDSQIALNNAKRAAESWNTYLSRYKTKLGIPDMEYAKLQAEVQKIITDTRNSDRAISETIRKNNADISFREQEVNNERAKTELEKVKTIFNMTDKTFDKIIKLIPVAMP